ncbi:hypothetical protein ACPZMI_17980, partial [Pseudomonas wayambapalatensis]|uniref:hypothetical protein n=1 Tax=Pseudomonas wayambapalatensis TaxID=485895 RepID=UPI003CEF8C6C
FGVTLTTHGTSYLGLIMRLGGVYETRGDSPQKFLPHGYAVVEKDFAPQMTAATHRVEFSTA